MPPDLSSLSRCVEQLALSTRPLTVVMLIVRRMRRAATMNVAATKERHRNKRLRRLLWILAPIAAWMWWRIVIEEPILPLPTLPQDAGLWIPFGILSSAG